MKRRFVATWSTMPGGFYDSASAREAVAFAELQQTYLPREGGWTVRDNITDAIIAYREAAEPPFYNAETRSLEPA